MYCAKHHYATVASPPLDGDDNGYEDCDWGGDDFDDSDGGEDDYDDCDQGGYDFAPEAALGA